MNKKIVLLLILIIGFVVLVVISFWLPGGRKPILPIAGPTPTKQAISLPVSPFITEAPKVVMFTYVGAAVDLPKELPEYVYDLSRPLALQTDQITKIAGLFGFTQAPVVKTKSGYVQYLWQSGAGYLSFNQQTSGKETVSLQYYQPPEIILNRANLEAAAADQLSRALENRTFKLRLISQQKGPFDGLILTDNPPVEGLVGYNFAYLTPNNYPLLVTNYDPSSFNLILDGNNKLRQFNFILPPLLQSGGNLALLGLNGALMGLNSGKGILISSLINQEMGTQADFSSVNLTGVEITYLVDQTIKKTFPVYLFTGTALTTQQKISSVKYLLNAVAD